MSHSQRSNVPTFELAKGSQIHFVLDGLNCFLMKMKSIRKSTPAIAAEVRPMMVQAIHAGMKALRYFSDPISRKRAAVPINNIARADKTLITILVIRSFWRRFLRAASDSRRYSLRMSFISLRNA